jgi:hypothetical protein
MIIIIGDSWGVGEWDKDCNLGGPGFGQYLMLHDRVVNLSIGSGSNTQSLDRLSEFLAKFRADEYETFYWIVTCPSRCIDIRDHLSLTKSLEQVLLDTLYQSMDRAQHIAQQHGIQINLIGGLCDLDNINITRFTRLNATVPSWGSLLTDKYITSSMHPVNWPEIGETIKKSYPHHLQSWHNIANAIIAKNWSWQQIFTTDGCHPDRKGHQILHDHLYPEWAWKIG